MSETIMQLEDLAESLQGILLIIMTCAETGDLPATAYVSAVGHAHDMACEIGNGLEALRV